MCLADMLGVVCSGTAVYEIACHAHPFGLCTDQWPAVICNQPAVT